MLLTYESIYPNSIQVYNRQERKPTSLLEKGNGPRRERVHHHWPRGKRIRSHRYATEWGFIMFPMLPTRRMTFSHEYCLLTSISIYPSYHQMRLIDG
nr:hypothetical protein Q903MT_gene4468 [Picea sitchensis]